MSEPDRLPAWGLMLLLLAPPVGIVLLWLHLEQQEARSTETNRHA